ncbi:MAG: CRTAC1 family protein [Acidobacteriota bacterium]
MNQTPNDRNLEDPAPEDELVHEDLVAEDDAIIGVAFRRSLYVLVAVAVLVGAGWLISSRDEEVAPETEITTAAPEAVTEAAEAPDVAFTDVTAEAGIDFVHVNGAAGDKLLPESMGGGVAFFDADGDGDQDLLFVNSTSWPEDPPLTPRPTMKLYRNDGMGRFSDATAGSGLDVAFYGMGLTAADLDGDDDADLFLTAVGKNYLFRNDSTGDKIVFTDVTESAGVAGGEDSWSTSAGFFDADNDGDLDLFVCNYVRWSREIDFEQDFRLTGVGRAYGPPQNYEGTLPYLYRNDSSGGRLSFTDISASAGVEIANPATGKPMAKALALAPIDVDQDGWMDVLIANDTVRNFFFRNRGAEGLGEGEPWFEEVGELVGVAYDRAGNATGAMGVDAAYYRNDHNLGFLIGNFANEMSSFYVSQDDPGIFADESIVEGIGAPSRRMLSFGVFLFDYDLDGRLDALQANGHLEGEIATVDPSQTYRQAAQLFWNGGLEDGFVPVEAEDAGDLAEPIVGRGSAFADIDADGDLDVVLTQIAGPPLLLRNDQALGHHWLRLDLRGKAPNRDAIGAWVELTAGGVTQRRQVMPIRSYQSQVERIVTFGLGTATQIESLIVTWPDGSKQELSDVAVDQVHTVEQQ